MFMGFIYKFLDRYDNVLYVGKTENLIKRMEQHFFNGHLDKKCYLSVNKIFYQKTGKKCETEMLETYYINLYHPKYNSDKVYLQKADINENRLVVKEAEWSPLYIDFSKTKLEFCFKKQKPQYFVNTELYFQKLSLLHNNLNLLQFPGFASEALLNLFKTNNYLEQYLSICNSIISNPECLKHERLSVFEEPLTEYQYFTYEDICTFIAVPKYLLNNCFPAFIDAMFNNLLFVPINDSDYFGLSLIDNSLQEFITTCCSNRIG